MTRPIRLALVMDHPAQHFASGLRYLAADPDLRVRVHYWSVAQQVDDADFDRSICWDTDLLGGYSWYAPPALRSSTARARWFIGKLRGTRPDVLICYGWASAVARMAIVYCLLTRTRLVLYGDSTWQHSSCGRRTMVRSMALRVLMRCCAGAISTGTFNREFYLLHGMDPRRVWPGVCPADTESFARARRDRHDDQSLPDTPVRIGFAGKLIPRKGADELLRAVSILPSSHNCSLTVVGDGPLMRDLQELTARLGVADRVTFSGFANTTEMPKLLASFDIVVVPSRLDLRTLLTIEAMAAGAAVVVSDATAVWGPGDLIEDGVTGLLYPSGDSRALADRLSRLIDDPHLLATIRANGALRAECFGPEPFARTMASAARRCVTRA